MFREKEPERVVTYTYNKIGPIGLIPEVSKVTLPTSKVSSFLEKLLKWEPQNVNKVRIEEK